MMKKTLIAGLVVMCAGLSAPAQASTSGGVKDMLDKLVADKKATAVLMRVDGKGTSWAESAGVRDLETGRPASANGHFRIGSVTKTFAATVMMQLVDEGKVALSAPVGRYLPGLIPQGDTITVRQILNHTSGLYDYMHEPGYSTNRWRGKDRFRHYEPRELLKVAFADPAKSTGPGPWHYSNTNYVVAALIIEKATGRPYGKEVARRILRPLGMTRTSVPGDRPGLPEPHARGYEPVNGTLVDATRMNPSLDGAAGEMISTGRDLNGFIDALLGGKLTSKRSLAAMRTTEKTSAGFEYGLGLQKYSLPCGKSAWGHSGELIGYMTFAFTTDDGKRMTLSINPSAQPGTMNDLLPIAAAALC